MTTSIETRQKAVELFTAGMNITDIGHQLKLSRKTMYNLPEISSAIKERKSPLLPTIKDSDKRAFHYGLSLQSYEALIIKQNNSCAVCGEVFGQTPCIDHNHKTGKVRGLLCRKCNTSLSVVEKPIYLKLLQYLKINEEFSQQVTTIEHPIELL